MNEHQQFNIDLLKKRDPSTFGWGYTNRVGFRCMICGAEINPGLIHDKVDVKTLLCADCNNEMMIKK